MIFRHLVALVEELERRDVVAGACELEAARGDPIATVVRRRLRLGRAEVARDRDRVGGVHVVGSHAPEVADEAPGPERAVLVEDDAVLPEDPARPLVGRGRSTDAPARDGDALDAHPRASVLDRDVLVAVEEEVSVLEALERPSHGPPRVGPDTVENVVAELVAAAEDRALLEVPGDAVLAEAGPTGQP